MLTTTKSGEVQVQSRSRKQIPSDSSKVEFPWTTIALTGLALMLLRILFVTYNAFFGPTASVPGPVLARFTKLRYLFTVWYGSQHKDNIALHRKYAQVGEYFAPVVRLGPDLYSIAAPDKTVYGINSRMPKGPWYTAWRNPDPAKYTIFTDTNIKRVAESRKKWVSMYSLSSVVAYESDVDECIDLFQRHLREAASSDQVLDLGHWFQCYAFDVIGYMTYGKRFGFLDEGRDVEQVLRMLDQNITYGTLMGIYAKLHPYLSPMAAYIGVSGPAALRFLAGWTSKHLAEVVALSKNKEDIESDKVEKRKTFTEKAVMKQQQDPASRISNWDLVVVCLSNVVAGSDTTAVTLSACLYYLIKNPHAMRKLRDEVAEAEERGELSFNKVSCEYAQTMLYLQAVIKEALRMHAAVGLPMWRETVDDSTWICNVAFPKGTSIGINPWVPHYNEDAWGPDVHEFKPERWLIGSNSSSSKRLEAMESSYVPFGQGARACFGRHISQLEMSKVLPLLIRNFDFELLHPDTEWHVRDMWFVKPTDFHVKLSLRDLRH